MRLISNIAEQIFPTLLRWRRYARAHPVLGVIIGSVWFLGFIPVLFYLLTLIGVFGSIPGKRQLLAHENLEAAQVYTIDSVLLGTYHLERRTSVSLDSVPPFLIDALLSTEDARFYDHGGIDVWSLLRVGFRSILLGDESGGGGSTLSQQLAKSWYPRKDYLLLGVAINKFREMAIARRMETTFSKQEILSLYLNSVSFGEEIFGLEAASQRYFSTSCSKLLPQESAMLVGMLKAPSAYHPTKRPEQALRRRNVVIAQVEKYEKITPLFADSLQQLPLQVNYRRQTHHDGLAPHFREHLRLEMNRWCEQYRHGTGEDIHLYRSGLRIYTSIHSQMQAYAEKALADQMKKVQARFDRHWKGYNLRKNAKGLIEEMALRCAAVQRWNAEGLSADTVEARLLGWHTRPGFSWNDQVQDDISLLDSLIQDAYTLQAGMLAIEPRSGHILAWVGGIDHTYSAFDQILARRQTGSVFKPIIYATALEEGEDPCLYISNEQETFDEYQGWTPRNSDNFYGGQYSMEGGLTHSVNVVSAKLIMKIGVEPVLRIAEKMGIHTTLPAVPAIALGAADVSLLEMAAVYATLANDGSYVRPRYLLRIEDREGKVLANYDNPDPGTQVLAIETAQMITDMLRATVDRGTARALRQHHRLRLPLAGKTGTAQQQRDGWFIAMAPSLVVGARVGAQDPRIHWRSLTEGQGAATALPMVGYFLQSVANDARFEKLTQAKFTEIPASLAAKMDCADFSFPIGMTEFKRWWRARSEADSLRRLGLPVPDSIKVQLQADWDD